MKKFLFLSDIFFVIADTVLFIMLIYCGIKKSFTLTIFAAMIVAAVIIALSVKGIVDYLRG